MDHPSDGDRAGMFACGGVDESAGVLAELRRTMRDGMLRTLSDDEVAVTLTAKGRQVALEHRRDRAGQDRLLRDLEWQARLQGGDHE